MFLFIGGITLALSVSFTCSLLEAVLLSLTPSQAADIAKRHTRIGNIWQRFKAEIEKPIAVILLLNTAAHTVGATVAGSQVQVLFGEPALAWFSFIFTFVMLQFTEILPKTLGVRHNRKLAVVLALPLLALVKAFSPVLSVIHFVNRPFERRMRGGDSAATPTLDEIAALAGMARLGNLISRHEEKIIREASRLSETSVREVMIPTDQITFFSTDQCVTDAILTAHMDPHTRFPICEGGDQDQVLGYVNFKELIYRVRTNPADPSLRGIIRPVHFVGPDESSANLLRVFVDEHNHIAIVRDEGKTLGMVTMEDIVEELVGELTDEFDRLPRMCHALSGGVWMVGGGFLVSQLAVLLHVDLPNPQGSLSSWLIERMGKVPERNAIHREGDAAFMVRRIRRGQIFEVAVSTGGGPLPLP